MRPTTFIVSMFLGLMSPTQKPLGADEGLSISITNPKGEIRISGEIVPLMRLTDFVWKERVLLGIPTNAVRCSAHVFGTWLVQGRKSALQLGVIGAPKGEEPSRRDVLLHLWPTDGDSAQNRWIKKHAPGTGWAVVSIRGKMPIIGSVVLLDPEESKEVLSCAERHQRPPGVLAFLARKERDT
jgi:hypothetical protein